MPISIVPDTGLGIILSNPPGSTTTVVGGVVIALPTVANSINILRYTKGGGLMFPSMSNDVVLEPGLYHGGNPLLLDEFQIPGYDALDISVETKDVYSTQTERGLFNIEYPPSGNVVGKINYIWNDIYTTPLGIYGKQSSVSDWNFALVNDVLNIQTNDVNTIPRVNDYIIFNYVPTTFTAYTNGVLPQRLPYFKGTETFLAKIVDVLILSGTGINVVYQIHLDKSYVFQTGEKFGIALLNRTNTSIQKELFYETFQQIEIHRQQLLGDPYNNQTNTSLPSGRMNYLNYGGASSLGVQNLLKGIINSTSTPFIVFDVENEIKDRLSFKDNNYDSDGKPTDIHFEFHTPFVMINDNLFPPVGGGIASPVDAFGNIIENIFVTNPASSSLAVDDNLGKYDGLYLKSDTAFVKRFGWVFYDLRLVVIDDAELATALGYNSNRNFTLPQPSFQSGSGNNIMNPGQGLNLDITNATNTSPIVVTTSSPYGLPRGAQVLITDVTGNTATNGTYYVDAVYGAPDIYKFELWQVMPQYVGGIRVAGTGIAAAGNGIFINNGIGNSGTVVGALPPYSYFYTYRIRNTKNNSTMPYATVTNFNFALSGTVDNSQGSLLANIGMFNWYDQQSHLSPFDLGFEMIPNTTDVGYGIDIIIGQYDTNPYDPINPTAIIGIKNVMCIPLTEMIVPFAGNPLLGLSFEVKKVQDYKRAIDETTAHTTDYTFDLYDNMPLYTYTSGTLDTSLLTGNSKWLIGNVIYRNHVEINRAYFSVRVSADKWNDSTNPSYLPSTNSFITDKYISEVAILLAEDQSGQNDLAPMIYAKISPAVKKTNDLDLIIKLSVDF